MRFFFKFVKLPYAYSIVSAANSSIAKEKVSKYRKDGVCFNEKDLCISFKEMHDKKFIEKTLEEIKERSFVEVKSSMFDHEPVTLTMEDNNIVDSLVPRILDEEKLFGSIPDGFKQGKVEMFNRSSREFALTMKADKKLIDWIKDKTGATAISITPNSFTPVFICKKVERKVIEEKSDLEIDA